MPNLCILHGAGCLPVSSAWYHRTRVDNESQARIFHQLPLHTGGFTMRNFFNKCSV
ncbi:hypothetical protein [Escherichia phage P13771]|uniref:Uncharacterized protein n=1 Tax=Escherichia phage P13771 TaxID=1429232 RepID=A0A0P0ZG79_9CAUD|nr:hypothetical protein [Escherichia phage P13771]